MAWFSRLFENIVANLVCAVLAAVGAVIWSVVKSLPAPVIFVIGLATFVLILFVFRLILSYLDRRAKNLSTSASGTVITIAQTKITKADYEQIKKTVLADIQSGKIRIKGLIRGNFDNIPLKEKAFIRLLNKQMDFEIGHGHGDELGLMADRASGVDLNELITRNCSICGKPRNKREDKK